MIFCAENRAVGTAFFVGLTNPELLRALRVQRQSAENAGKLNRLFSDLRWPEVLRVLRLEEKARATPNRDEGSS